MSVIKKIIPEELTLKHLALIGFLAALFVGLFIFFLRRGETLEVEMQITDLSPLGTIKKPNVFLGRDIEVGDVEKNAGGFIYATVIDLERYPIDSGEEVEDIFYLKVKLKTVFNPRQNRHTYKGRPVLIGSELRLNLNNTLIEGLVTSIEGKDPIHHQRIIMAELTYETIQNGSEIFGVDPWIANSIEIGDSFVNMYGKSIAEILEKSVRPADYLVVTDDGRTLVSQHPLKKRVILKLRVSTDEIQGIEFYLHRIPFRIGAWLPIFFDDVSISPQVIEILE